MCVESTSFSVQINGELVDYYDEKRCLHQGNPISPLLFTIVMEYLSRLLKGLNKDIDFYHHPKCNRVDLKHIIFADDLFLLRSGTCSAITAINDVIKEFLAYSGLSVNVDKIQIFTAGMDEGKKSWIESLLSTKISLPPVKYLGFPLTTRNICYADYSTIIQRLMCRLENCNNRFLLRAGRRSLIQPVLQAIVI
ncbi:hypothetical protein QQ045_005524 [Rhodiola kirilowii]